MRRGSALLGVFVAVVVVIAIIVAALPLLSAPAQKECSVKVVVQGTYTSVGIDYFTGVTVSASEGGCSSLPSFALPSMNLFPASVSATVTAMQGSTPVHVDTIGIDIPALTTSYAFTQTATFTLPPGTYAFVFDSGTFGANGAQTTLTVT